MRRTTAALGAVAVLAGVLAGGFAPQAVAAAGACGGMGTPITQVAKTSGPALLTAWPSEATSAANLYGFSESLGTPFYASTWQAGGLASAHRVFHPTTNDFAWFLEGSAGLATALASGYVDQGTDFFVSAQPDAQCTVPVTAFVKDGRRRYAPPAGAAALQAAGWVASQVVFHAAPGAATPPITAPPTGDTQFSFAVIPDVQNEVGNDERMPQRVSWLAANKSALDLRWALLVGDVQSWDTPDHYQYVNMSSRLQGLRTAGIPYLSAVGNHDTNAVCPGGSACPGADTHAQLRNTTTWNTYYPASSFGLTGAYDPAKSDNAYRTFSAGGVNWLVLTVELWPRPALATWARSVVAAHPKHNVIVLTHAFLEGNGAVSTSQGGYGDTSPASLWGQLDDYPNVVMVFSGHTGTAANTTLTAPDGHKVGAFLTTFHHPSTNPVRIVTVDTAGGTISTNIQANYDNSKPAGQRNVTSTYPYSTTISGMKWIRP